MPESLLPLYRKLKLKYGRPAGQWKLWCKRPKTLREREQVVIESILTQRANWRNVEQAVENLKAAGCLSLPGLLRIPVEQLGGLIVPSGFYRQKARRLLALADLIEQNCGGLLRLKEQSAEGIRRLLLQVSGVGPETADDILLYALDRPVIVVDEYTPRLAKLLNFPCGFSYQALQNYFQERLPRNYGLYQDFHALIVIDGKARKGKKGAT
ncbi:MAG TPA: hypothetical protein PKX93_05775 [bacterium]|nr:hypothetical protein [bacterium]